jgi:hypothetical protein
MCPLVNTASSGNHVFGLDCRCQVRQDLVFQDSLPQWRPRLGARYEVEYDSVKDATDVILNTNRGWVNSQRGTGFEFSGFGGRGNGNGFGNHGYQYAPQGGVAQHDIGRVTANNTHDDWDALGTLRR